ncbi:MAG: glycosyltransferase, partial [Chloroflexi bacterium]
LGVGPKPVFIDKLNIKRLAQAIRQAVSDTTMQARAAQLGEQIRQENGVQVAVDIIERYLAD